MHCSHVVVIILTPTAHTGIQSSQLVGLEHRVGLSLCLKCVETLLNEPCVHHETRQTPTLAAPLRFLILSVKHKSSCADARRPSRSTQITGRHPSPSAKRSTAAERMCTGRRHGRHPWRSKVRRQRLEQQ